MFRANDINGNSIFIDDANKNNKYFCPACNEPLILKIFGTRKKHCFSHYPRTTCKDNWNYEPMSEWHSNWQNYFDKENQEIWIKGENEVHRADVSIRNYIIEFQHSAISSIEFNKRNKFYTSCNKNVVWIFDIKNQISINDDGTFNWEKKNIFENTFVDFINYNNKISVFFEIEKIINDSLYNILIPIINFNEKRYFRFKTLNYYIQHLNFLKDYIDISHFEHFCKCKIPSINELLHIDNQNIKNSRNSTFVPIVNSFNTRPGPKEWYLTRNKTYKKNYNRKKYR